MQTVASLPSPEELADHVRKLLCEHDSLDPRQTPFECAVVTRCDRPCGMFFQVSGPRSMRTYAIWASDENRVLFYDAKGTRFHEMRLSESPDPAALAKA